MKNIGVLGGTFDPPHEAHLKIAERSLNQFKLDKIIFIPSGNPWQKKDSTPYSHRFEMTKILIKNSDSLQISDLESSEKNPSYTYETLEKLQHPKENSLNHILLPPFVLLKSKKSQKRPEGVSQ